tara:strand:+ start:968 stop:1411 length:444 start_codon:yes stop_codon:yes gene_type:complete
MLLEIRRKFHGLNSTGGMLSVDGIPRFFTVEDKERSGYKVPNNTCIARGQYQVKFREQVSGLTKRYRKKYDWFSYHLHIQDVPNFQWCYLHIGNTHDDVEGCVAVGKYLAVEKNDFRVVRSGDAFKELYMEAAQVLKSGGEIILNIV